MIVFISPLGAKHAKKAPKKLLTITVIDVGQGDCSLIQLPNGKTVLVDAGSGGIGWNPFDAGSTIVVPFLKKMGVKYIDYIIMTHAHSDHIGGVRPVVKKFDVGTLVDSGFPASEEDYELIMEIAEKKDIKLLEVHAGDVLNWDRDCKIKVLSPPRKYIMGGGSPTNENSVVFKLTYKDISFIFTGDAEKQAGKKIVRAFKDELLCTFLKVSHHGSKNSLTYNWFLDWAQPIVSIICVGQNTWGHPNRGTLKKLDSYGSLVYRTDRDGTIKIVTDGKTYKISFIAPEDDERQYSGGAK
ncbi:MAG: MBL fold metallo-hydrolase [Elusimicrobia bacterium]|nr:MBL fold metallo-hydrolase [Elusimicrobiota bacterium]